MSCFDCRFYTGEDFLSCAVNSDVAANSPELGCWDWQPNPNPWGFWEILVNAPHVDDVQIGSVPVQGWQQLLCHLEDVLIYQDEIFRIEPIEDRLKTLPKPYIGEWAVVGFRVIGNSLWRTPQGRVVGYAEAWDLEYRDWYSDPDPLSGPGQMVLWLTDLLNY